MRRTTTWLIAAVLTTTAAPGCRHTCCRKSATGYPPPPPPGVPLIQPQPLPPSAGPAPEVLPPAPPPPGVSAAPAPVSPAPSGYPPIARLDAASPAIHLLPPELGESVTQASANEPAPAAGKPSIAPSLPVGIPDFAPAIPDKVANGRKPTLDGLDWLKANGYRGALLLRGPGETDAADRRQFEARGLTFASLEVSLTNLDRSTVEQFNHLIADTSRQPLFVYDADGSLTGPLWYLYFRRVEHTSDDAARARAERLGLKLDERDKRLSWLAVQDFLAKNP